MTHFLRFAVGIATALSGLHQKELIHKDVKPGNVLVNTNPMELVHSHIARQPVPPGERLNGIPGLVSAIVMKLLAKTAEERYQTAAGAASDLRRCLDEWETRAGLMSFRLANTTRQTGC
jgi:serine/threonine protein kinase